MKEIKDGKAQEKVERRYSFGDIGRTSKIELELGKKEKIAAMKVKVEKDSWLSIPEQVRKKLAWE